MGMSTHIQGFKTPDKKWEAMKAVWDACQKAEIEVPEEVSKYFDWDTPDARGVEVKLEGTECCSEWMDHYRSGIEIDVRKLPSDLTHIRFFNSY